MIVGAVKHQGGPDMIVGTVKHGLFKDKHV